MLQPADSSLGLRARLGFGRVKVRVGLGLGLWVRVWLELADAKSVDNLSLAERALIHCLDNLVPRLFTQSCKKNKKNRGWVGRESGHETL